MLANRNTIMGLGDGGAHVGFILDAGFPTWLLTYWGRERRAYPVEELIRRLTSDPVSAAGLADRGILAAGKKADINIIVENPNAPARTASVAMRRICAISAAVAASCRMARSPMT